MVPMIRRTPIPSQLRRSLSYECICIHTIQVHLTVASNIHHVVNIKPNMHVNLPYCSVLSVLGLCLRINESGLFAWISLTALSLTYFIIHEHCTIIVSICSCLQIYVVPNRFQNNFHFPLLLKL